MRVVVLVVVLVVVVVLVTGVKQSQLLGLRLSLEFDNKQFQAVRYYGRDENFSKNN